MSDTGRKDMTTKISEAVTPDSSKSQTEKTKEGVTDIGDKAARGAQGDSTKSTSQSIADKTGQHKDSTKEGGSAGSVIDSAKQAVGLDKK